MTALYRERLGRPYGEVPAVRGSFSVRPPAEPDVPAFPASGSLVTFAVAGIAAGGRSAWIWSWQGGQTTRDLRRFAAMSLAHAGWPGPGYARSASLATWCTCTWPLCWHSSHLSRRSRVMISLRG